MDGLLAHILHELAFEGDLGSDVTRLRQIISQYYSVHPLTSDRAQNVDDKFCAFIWSWLASQSGVVVGVAPSGAEAVYFPPRTGEAKVAIKGKSKAQPDSAASLSPLPPDEATQPLDVLVTKYGGGLRIAVAPDVCFACITGSHIRPPKLSTNAYAVLQLITRSRREGVSVADISRQSGYDPKTCFYFIKILVDLGHVLKIKVGGAAVNVCVHKSFYDDQCVWKQAAKEEAAEPNFDVGAEAQGEENDENDDASGEYTSNFQFELIDNRHMSNPTVVKTRIERLLRHMPEGLHVYRYLLEAIGFKTSLKKERRVFTHRVTELLKSRFIEKVWAPSNSSSSGRVLCIRLVTNDSIPQDLGSAENGAEDEQDVGAPEGTPVDESTAQNDIDSTSLDQFEGVHATQSIAAQVISMVEQSDTTGMTFAEISKNLHNFDSRSVTNLISRFSSGQPPTHLTHRGLAVTTETFGRERRQRVYSIAGYRKMIEQEGLEDQSVVDPKGSGTWALFEPDDFLADEGEREEWLETFVREALAHGGKKAHAQRSKKGRVNPLDKSGVPVKGRPRNTRVHEPTAEKKQGRPPKRKPDEAEGNNGADQPPATKKRRGRPPKAKATDGLDNAIASPVDDPSMATNTPPEKSTPKRKRPRVKNPIQPDAGVALGEQLSGEAGQGRSNKGATDCLEHNLIEGPSTRINDISLHNPNDGQLESSTHLFAVNETGQRRSSRLSQTSPSRSPTRPSKRPRLSRVKAQKLDAGQSKPSQTIETERQEGRSRPPEPTLSSTAPFEDLIPIPDQENEPAPATEEPNTGSAVTTGQIPNNLQASQRPTQPALRQGKTTNVSALRRQTEILQLIENMGGVANVSLLKNFSDEHQKLLQVMSAAGKAASAAPGTEMDKRTFNSTITALESRGLVKMLVVSALTTHGTTRRATIVHLANASSESIEKCIEEFRSSGPTKGIPAPSDYPEVPRSVSHVSSENPAPARAPGPSLEPPPPTDPLAAARQLQLSDPKTAAQYVGYITGHFSRARTLHLRLLLEIGLEVPPTRLVSPDAKIFSREYFFDDLPIATYCMVIPHNTVIPGLKEMLEVETARETRIRDVEKTIQASLRCHSTTNRGRMQKLLTTLVDLGCLVPAKMEVNLGSSVTGYVDIPDPDEHWEYCRLVSAVPVYRFADKTLEAPLCHYHEVRTFDDGTNLWDQFHQVSQPSTCSDFKISASGTLFPGDPKLLKAICRAGAWEDQYVLSRSQKNYLNELVDAVTGVTPLDDAFSTRFDNACFITTAPINTVSAFFSRAREDIQRDLESVKALAKQQTEAAVRLAEGARQALAAKAAQAKKEQEARWDMIVSNSLNGLVPPHSQFQKALATLKSTYSISPQRFSDSSWESKIRDTLRDSLGAKQFVIPSSASAPVPQAASEVGKSPDNSNNSVSSLILQQGAPIPQKDIAPKKSGRKSKKQIAAAAENVNDAPTPESESRRRRFPWNPEYDELARDAGAIIRVRCRSKRIDWSALEQVFPGVQRNSVRQRIASLETLPGASEYYRRLDEAWATLWLEHRGTEALPDPNPDSLSEFDLPTYVTFLRKHVDKKALHAGSENHNTDASKRPVAFASVEQILADYKITEISQTSQPTCWDFCFDLASEEPREREFLQHPFVVGDPAIPPDDTPLGVSVAQAAVKMIISTPEASYDNNDAAAMLALIGEDSVKLAVDSMDDSIIKKKSKAGRNYPIRQYTYSDSVISRLKGDFASSMYADASVMREHLSTLGGDEWRNVDLTDENGEIAAYLQLMSENKVEITVDTSVPAAGRNQLGWQSKKVDDENLEAYISLRLNTSRDDNNSRGSQSVANLDDAVSSLAHIPTAACPHTAENPHTCAECLNIAAGTASTPNQPALLDTLREVGTLGLPIQRIFHVIYNNDASTMLNSLSTLTRTSPPLVYVLGYDQARIVFASALCDWAVKLVQSRSNSSGVTFNVEYPRQWLTIHGNMIEDIWVATTRCIIGALMYRPSINEYALRQRYRGLLDRQELNDILRYLLETKKLERITNTSLPIGMLSPEDEKTTYWLLAHGSTWL